MVSQLFHALGNETRVTILRLLAIEGELSVNEVTERMSISQSNVSSHLRMLKDAGAAEVEVRKNQRIYRAKPAVLNLLDRAQKVYLDS